MTTVNVSGGITRTIHVTDPDAGTTQVVTVGLPGARGLKGDPGQDGRSAYELAVEAGFVGTEAAWLDSLPGADGQDGLPGTTTWAGITDKPTIPDSADDIGAETPAGAQAKADAAEAAANAYADTAVAGLGGGGGGAVDSVNGQTGVVVLDAADVSARPDTYVPTWAEVTGKPATFPAASHSHPAAEVTGLATVATSGAYADLTGKPAIPDSADDVGADPAGAAAAAQAAAISAAASDATTKANAAEANAKAASTPIAHVTDTTNPHAVTKAQVGLGSVPNVDATSRANHTGTQPATTITGLATVATSGAYADLSGTPSGGTASGTAFPASPTAGTRFFRTDRNLEYVYNGTRWLTTTLLSHTGTQATALAANGVIGRLTFPNDADVYLEQMYATVFLGTNSAANYWSINIVKYADDNTTKTQIGGISTAASPASGADRIGGAIGAVFAASDTVVNTLIEAVKTGAPTTLYAAVTVTYRLIG